MGVTLEVDLASDLPPVAMDEGQVRQALLNLLRNAREAMPEGGRVRFEVQAEDGGVTVRVSDQGPGIPREQRERIFDLFYTTKERGTGLGLPLTQQIVVAHGGRIRCDGRAGRGNDLRAVVPRRATTDAPSVAPPLGAAAELREKRMTRSDGRGVDALRPVAIDLGIQKNPEGSLIYRSGGTSVLIAASVEERVPDWMRGGGRGGWITAEYAMHPRANPERRGREGRKGRIDGRSQEIQRLVARSLRSAVRLERLGDRQITVDCDVLDADGGTRTASITGGFVALAMALESLRRRGLVEGGVLRTEVAAISVGLLEGKPLLDLCYVEDRDAEVDLNVVGTDAGALVEVQGTAEGAPISRDAFDRMIDLALGAMPALVAQQRKVLKGAGIELDRLLGR